MLHIIMEYCDSGDLQTMLARKKRPLEEKMVSPCARDSVDIKNQSYKLSLTHAGLENLSSIDTRFGTPAF